MACYAWVLTLSWMLIAGHVLMFSWVPTGSMEPLVPDHSMVIASRVSYVLTDPRRGDVVIFPAPDNTSMLYVKRIVGLPGDHVEIKDERVYVNGQALDEPYLVRQQKTITSYGQDMPTSWDVPADSYFMLGDNRMNSLDSRFWKEPFVKRDDIIARVGVVIHEGRVEPIDKHADMMEGLPLGTS